MSNDDDADLALDSVFPEPPRPPTPEPTVEIYTRASGYPEGQERHGQNDWRQIEIRLVGSHPLWGHHLWNAARAFATYLDVHPEMYRGRCVLELGAGGGLPGIVAANNGAAHVVLTDYPDSALIANLEYNVLKNTPVAVRDNIYVQGYIWGHPVESLLQGRPVRSGGFDLIILSDLIFNHSQHDALLNTCDLALGFPVSPTTPHPPPPLPPPALLVFYTHHRPHLAAQDLAFFEKARERGWVGEEVVTQTFPPMFPDDPGDESVRATVHGWRLTRI